MKNFIRTMRERFHNDIIAGLERILLKLNENKVEQAHQNIEIRNKIQALEKKIESLQYEYEFQIDKKIQNCKEIIEINNSKLISSINKNNIELNRIREKLYRNDWEPKQNIKQYLQQVAGLQTAGYIIENMPDVPAFNVTLDILTYGISQVSVDGMFLEFGVFSGTTINHIADKIKEKTIYGFDSFEGLPEDWRTGFEEGTFKRDDLPEVKENVQLVKGWFNNTLPTFIQKHTEKCAFIHIDCDLYSSTKCIFDLLKDRIVSGTIIVFDEYFNYPDWQNGEYKALQEFVTENNLSYEYIGYVEIMEQVAIKIL